MYYYIWFKQLHIHSSLSCCEKLDWMTGPFINKIFRMWFLPRSWLCKALAVVMSRNLFLWSRISRRWMCGPNTWPRESHRERERGRQTKKRKRINERSERFAVNLSRVEGILCCFYAMSKQIPQRFAHESVFRFFLSVSFYFTVFRFFLLKN